MLYKYYIDKQYYVSNVLFNLKTTIIKENILCLWRYNKKEEFYKDLNNPCLEEVMPLEHLHYTEETKQKFKETPVSKESIDMYIDEDWFYLHVHDGLKINLIRDFDVHEVRVVQVKYKEEIYSIGIVYYATDPFETWMDLFLPRSFEGISNKELDECLEENVYKSYLSNEYFLNKRKERSFKWLVCKEAKKSFENKYGTRWPIEYYLGKPL